LQHCPELFWERFICCKGNPYTEEITQARRGKLKYINDEGLDT